MKRFTIAALGLGLWLARIAAEDKPPSQAGTSAAEWSSRITDTAQLPVGKNGWGTIQWVCNGKLMPGADQTMGLATILPGKQNPTRGKGSNRRLEPPLCT